MHMKVVRRPIPDFNDYNFVTIEYLKKMRRRKQNNGRYPRKDDYEERLMDVLEYIKERKEELEKMDNKRIDSVDELKKLSEKLEKKGLGSTLFNRWTLREADYIKSQRSEGALKSGLGFRMGSKNAAWEIWREGEHIEGQIMKLRYPDGDLLQYEEGLYKIAYKCFRMIGRRNRKFVFDEEAKKMDEICLGKGRTRSVYTLIEAHSLLEAVD
ncbi:MAG: hypothetical protein ACE5J7_05420, partial [Candidatus Aenigmatarchaeota archaeon]